MTGQGIIVRRPAWSLEMKFAPCSSCTIRCKDKNENLAIGRYCLLYLELEREPTRKSNYYKHKILNEPRTPSLSPLCQTPRRPWRKHLATSEQDDRKRTLMIIASVDWNRDGLAVGSKMTEDAWKDWKRSVMSRDRAKLFLKRTWEGDSWLVV